MTAALDVVREHGGTCRTRDLRTAGLSGRAIASAVASGRIERARIGHYVAPELPLEVKRAIRVGGRLTCVSAAAVMGLRVLNRPDHLHVEVQEHDSRFREPHDHRRRLRAKGSDQRSSPGVRFHWAGRPTPKGARLSLPDVLAEVLGCLPELDALCIIDSARELVGWAPGLQRLEPGLQRLEDDAFREFIGRLPPHHRDIAVRSSTLSQAVGETIARERFRQAGITATPQAPLPGGFFADLLIGDRLVIECEGFEAHGHVKAFHRDRERLAWLRACGFVVLNFSHKQIVEDWPSVLSSTVLAMRRGAHLSA